MMRGWGPRAFTFALAVGLGVLVGQDLEPIPHRAGAVLGGVVGVVLATLVDIWGAVRLRRWMEGPVSEASLTPAAPRLSGFWGDVAYRVERALRRRDRQVLAERDRLRRLIDALEATPNGVLLLDERDRVEWANRTAALHFGLDPERDVGQVVSNLVRVPAFVRHLQSGPNDEPVVFGNARRGGTLSVLMRPYGGGKKLLLSQDITDAERTEAMRRDFVANVSHEIRTPLTVIAGFIESLEDDALPPERRRHALGLMDQQARRMVALVDDLLTLARLEGNPQPPADQWLPVDDLLGQLRDDALVLSAGRHAITVAADPDAAAAAVDGDAAELLSALGNLMSNAVRYTPAGGSIGMVWQVRPDGRGAFVCSDTGPGIAAEHLPRITERFYRVDGSRSRATGGTGLGLSIVKHVAQRHGGELGVESTVGQGSRFSFVLPAVRVRRAGAPRERAEPPVSAAPVVPESPTAP